MHTNILSYLRTNVLVYGKLIVKLHMHVNDYLTCTDILCVEEEHIELIGYKYDNMLVCMRYHVISLLMHIDTHSYCTA